MAPEVLSGHYDSKADIWSLGVLLYVLVSGYLPFQGQTTKEVFSKIRNASFHFQHKEFSNVSKDCKDLISKLLVVDPRKRLSGADAMRHPWFNTVKSITEDNELTQTVISRFRSFRGVSTFKKAAMNILVKTIDKDEVAHLREVFEQMDKNKNGMIDAKDLAAYLKAKNAKMSQQEV